MCPEGASVFSPHFHLGLQINGLTAKWTRERICILEADDDAANWRRCAALVQHDIATDIDFVSRGGAARYDANPLRNGAWTSLRRRIRGIRSGYGAIHVRGDQGIVHRVNDRLIARQRTPRPETGGRGRATAGTGRNRSNACPLAGGVVDASGNAEGTPKPEDRKH